jgi:hypothetical protein
MTVPCKKTLGFSQPRWAIWREIWKLSCLPSLYTVSVEKLWTQNTHIIHDVWRLLILSNEEKRMIMKILKKEWFIWKFWKRNDLYENFEKMVVVEKRGEEETKSMPHAPVGITDIWCQNHGITDLRCQNHGITSRSSC